MDANVMSQLDVERTNCDMFNESISEATDPFRAEYLPASEIFTLSLLLISSQMHILSLLPIPRTRHTC